MVILKIWQCRNLRLPACSVLYDCTGTSTTTSSTECVGFPSSSAPLLGLLLLFSCFLGGCVVFLVVCAR